MKIEDIKIGDIYYLTCRYDCKSCFKVTVEEILDNTSVKVKPKSHKKNQEPKSFNIYISALHKTSKNAVHGYKQHH